MALFRRAPHKLKDDKLIAEGAKLAWQPPSKSGHLNIRTDQYDATSYEGKVLAALYSKERGMTQKNTKGEYRATYEPLELAIRAYHNFPAHVADDALPHPADTDTRTGQDRLRAGNEREGRRPS